jgi:hypothetical protein
VETCFAIEAKGAQLTDLLLRPDNFSETKLSDIADPMSAVLSKLSVAPQILQCPFS